MIDSPKEDFEVAMSCSSGCWVFEVAMMHDAHSLPMYCCFGIYLHHPNAIEWITFPESQRPSYYIWYFMYLWIVPVVVLRLMWPYPSVLPVIAVHVSTWKLPSTQDHGKLVFLGILDHGSSILSNWLVHNNVTKVCTPMIIPDCNWE